jgi:hypothetical protein
MPAEPPAAGYGRVVMDTPGVPMEVTARALARFMQPAGPGARAGVLCTTPCWQDLPVGSYELYLASTDPSIDRGDVDRLQVSSGINYYLRAPGKYETPRQGRMMGAGVVMGLGFAVLGVAPVSMMLDDRGVAAATIGISALVGLSLVIVGAILANRARAEQQQGATTFWVEPVQ